MSQNDHPAKRRQFLVEKEVQIGYVLTLFVPLAFISLLFLFLLSFSVREAGAITKRDAAEKVNAIIKECQKEDSLLSTPEMVAMVTHIRNSFQGGTALSLRDDHFFHNVSLFVLAVLFSFILLYFVAIFYSHRFVGPLYRLRSSCKRVAEGDYREVIFLRDGDKLDRLAEDFNLMVSITRMRLAELSSKMSDEDRKKISDNLKI